MEHKDFRATFQAVHTDRCGKCEKPILPGMLYVWMWKYEKDKVKYFRAHRHCATKGVSNGNTT